MADPTQPAAVDPTEHLISGLLAGLTPEQLAHFDALTAGPAPTMDTTQYAAPQQGFGSRLVQGFSGLEQQPQQQAPDFSSSLLQGFGRGLGSAGSRIAAQRAKLEQDALQRTAARDQQNHAATAQYNALKAGGRGALLKATIEAGLAQSKDANKDVTVTPDLLAQAPKGSVAATLKPGTALSRTVWERALTDQTPGAAAAAQQAAKPQGNADDVKAIADGVVSGDISPDLKGLYRMGGPVQAELARRGYNLKNARNDYFAVQRNLASLNGPQQTRLRQAIDTAYSSLDVIDELNNKLQKLVPRGSWAGFNRVKLAALANQPGEAGIVARQLEAQITDVTSELGNAYMGGNSPTDHALQLAGKNLSENWSAPQLSRLVGQARLNLQIRRNSIYGSAPVTEGMAVPAPPAAPFDPSQHWGTP
jgi:hypothetical protein